MAINDALVFRTSTFYSVGSNVASRSSGVLAGLFLYLSFLGVSGSLIAASAQTCAVNCASACGPRQDFPAGVYNECVQTCGKRCNSCETAPGPTAFLYPKYYVLGLIYSPPGCTKTASFACGTQSTVDYQTGSSMGTKVSTSDSYESGIDVKADASVGLGDKGGAGSFGLGVSGGYSTTSTDSSSQTLTKTSTMDIKATGNEDGVNHDQDVFILMLNPAVAVNETHTFTGLNACHAGGVAWNFGLNTKLAPNQAIYKVDVAGLKNPATLPADVLAQLNQLNFTPTDFQTILSLDPFTGTPPVSGFTPDPSRFVLTTNALPYEAASAATDCNGGVCNCVLLQGELKNELASDNTESSKSEYKVGVSESLNGINAGIFKFGETVDLSYTWTSISTTDDLTGSSQSATVTMQCPSPSYSAPETLMAIYWDTLYGSFMFLPTSLGSPSALLLTQGTVTGANGQVLPHQPVDLAFGTKTLHTVTDSKGKYVFSAPASFNHPPTGTLSSMGTSQPATLGSIQDIKTTVK
jgi:hypothetical protein